MIEVLNAILTACNATGESDVGKTVDVLQRSVLWSLKDHIAKLPEYQTNDALETLDDAFEGAEWDSNGFRWVVYEASGRRDIEIIDLISCRLDGKQDGYVIEGWAASQKKSAKY